MPFREGGRLVAQTAELKRQLTNLLPKSVHQILGCAFMWYCVSIERQPDLRCSNDGGYGDLLHFSVHLLRNVVVLRLRQRRHVAPLLSA